MGYVVLFSSKAKKALKHIDKHEVKLIIAWIEKNLVGCDNPRNYGKALVGDKSGYWRYRVGSYRIICEIHDDKVIINVISIGHRRDIYKGKY